MRRLLDPTKVGGIPSTIEFDKNGNRKVKKDLGVEGKLTLKSLVSSTNPDGDITKELGGEKPLYLHAITISADSKLFIGANIYSYQQEKFTTGTFKQVMPDELEVSGAFVLNDITYLAKSITKSASGTLTVNGLNITDITTGGAYTIPSRWYLFDHVKEVK